MSVHAAVVTTQIDLGMNLSLHIVSDVMAYRADATMTRMPDHPLESDVMLNRWVITLDPKDYDGIQWTASDRIGSGDNLRAHRIAEDLLDAAKDQAGRWLRRMAFVIDERPMVTSITVRNEPASWSRSDGVSLVPPLEMELEVLKVTVQLEHEQDTMPGRGPDRVVFEHLIPPLEMTIDYSANAHAFATRAVDPVTKRWREEADERLAKEKP